MNPLLEHFELRQILPSEGVAASDIEQICFPPNEACTAERMLQRVAAAPELFLTAIEKSTGKMVGFLNGLATDETVFRDEFFTDISLHNPNGKTVMLLGLDVLPDYRRQGLARLIVAEYCARQKAAGRNTLLLTCLDSKVEMYRKFGFVDLGAANSSWGGEAWHEMRFDLSTTTE